VTIPRSVIGGPRRGIAESQRALRGHGRTGRRKKAIRCGVETDGRIRYIAKQFRSISAPC
jgi:hypothetical protein